MHFSDTEQHSDANEQSESPTSSKAQDPAAVIDGMSKTVRRQRVFLAAACVAALAAGGGLVASTFIESPAQQAAETKPPKPTVLTAPVQKKVLTDTVTTRGTVGTGGDITFTPSAGGQGSASAGGGALSLVVSKLYAKAADNIRDGQVLIEVSGRPIIALSGAVPAYRDLKPGMDGPDIAQLQAALKQLGHNYAPDISGHFGEGTKAALGDFYTTIGYSVPTTGGPNDAGDSTALQSASDAVTTQRRAVQTAYGLLQKANQALAAAKETRSPRTVPTSSTGPSAEPGQQSLQAAQDAQQAAETTYSNALHDLSTAEKKQTDLITTTGPMLPAAEVVFIPSFPVRLSKLNASLGSTVTAPLLTLESGQLVVTSLLQPGQNTMVKPGAKVELICESLGQTATATVTSVGPYSDGSTSNGQNGNGRNAGSAGPNSGQTAGSTGTAPQPPTQLPGYPMTITPDAPLNGAWDGQDVRVTIVNAATGSAVLSVPLSAVSTGADGQSAVTVVAADGSQRRVLVTAGASADGDVQVTPTNDDVLREGDQVAIGKAQQ